MKAASVIVTVLAGALLGLSKIGATPIAPGTDIGFAWRVDQGDLHLTADSGELECWIRLDFERPVPADITASLSDGTGLKADADGTTLDISAADSNLRARNAFRWPAGLRVDVHGTALPGVADWSVHLKKSQGETRARARWRRVLFWVFLCVLVVSLPAAIYKNWPRGEKAPVTLGSVILGLIETMQGPTPEEADRKRRLLRQVVLDHVDPLDALKNLGLPPGSKARQFWLKTRSEFLYRLRSLADELMARHKGLLVK